MPEQARGALDLVEDDQLVRVLWQVQLRFGELGPVGLGLEIEIDRWPPAGELERQRGLADLTRPEQRHGRGLGQRRRESRKESAPNHLCNYGVQLRKCNISTARSMRFPRLVQEFQPPRSASLPLRQRAPHPLAHALSQRPSMLAAPGSSRCTAGVAPGHPPGATP